MMELTVVREEFGFKRTTCGCKICQVWCKHQPGYLVPSDLQRLVPQGLSMSDILKWSEEHLRASPGYVRKTLKDGVWESVQIPSLVPAKNLSTGHCHWYKNQRCMVHANSPFGCAFQDEHMKQSACERRDDAGRNARDYAFATRTLYCLIWEHLWNKGMRYTTGGDDRDAAQREARTIERHQLTAKLRQQKKQRRKQR